jgi:hypothetical protein
MYPLSLIKDGEDHRFFRASAEFFIVAPQILVIGSETSVGYATSNGGADLPLEFALGRFLFAVCGLSRSSQVGTPRESCHRGFHAEVPVEGVRRLTMMVRFESRTGKADSNLGG